MWNKQSAPNQVFPKSRRSSRVRRLFFILVFPFCFFPLNAQAGEVTLAWDPHSTEHEGFILSYGTSSGLYSENQDVGTKTVYTVPNLNAGQTYFFAVKAYNTNQNDESSYSGEVSVMMPVLDTTSPDIPKSVQIISSR